MESFNLNIIPGKDRPVCHASQFDIGRQFHVNLFEGFNVFTLDGTETISLSVRKPDGNVVTASVTNTSDSYVEFVTTEQMTACEGSNLCELKLEKGSDVIGTANFILEVEVDPLEGGVQSASEIDNLQTQVAGMVATEVADQYDSANVIFDAVPTAGHGNGYAVTSEGLKNELDPIKADVSSLQSDVVNLQDDISDAYDDTATYAEGDIVIYDGVLYECTVTGGITTPESWDPTHWTTTTIKSILGDTHIVKTNINPSVVPTGYITKNATEIHDINDSQVLRLEAYQAANTGNIRGQLAINRVIGGTPTLNYLYLGIKPNGDKEVFVSADAEWRDALSVPQKLYIGTQVSNFSNGVFYIPFSTLGLTSKPNCVCLTPSRADVMMGYDWDNSSSSVGLKIFCTRHDNVGISGNIRYSIAILA